MAETGPLHTLAELLRGSGAQPLFSPERLAPSTLYDLQYRLAVTACAFETHAKAYSASLRRIQGAKLKLLQFIAIRPWLVPVVREWAGSRRDPQLSLLMAQRLRRGFLGDAMHDDVIAFWAARGILTRNGAHLLSGTNVALLANLHSAMIENNLFAPEREALQQLAGVTITNAMLEGW